MAEQIKFGDRLFLKGAKVFLDSGPTDNAILETRSGTVEIAGNLVVQGSTTTVNSETVSVADPFMLLNGDHTGAASEDVGIEINRGSDTNVKFGWNETTDTFSTFAESLETGSISATNIVASAGIVADINSENAIKIIDITGDGTVDINAGNIDGTVIGANTPAQATFTTLTWSVTTNTTDDLPEGTNQYFTDQRARAAISVEPASELSYDPATGEISFSGNYYSDTDARQAISVIGNEIGYDNTTGIISYDAPTDFGLLTDTNVISGSTGGSTGSSLPTNVSSLFNDAGYLTEIVTDPTPRLGGHLDTDNYQIFTNKNTDSLIDLNYSLPSDSLEGIAIGGGSSINMFLDKNNVYGNAGYFALHSNKDPMLDTVNKANSIFSISENGNVTITGDILGVTTDNLSEGTNNLYYTDSKVQGVLTNMTTGLFPSADNTYDIGSNSFQWRRIYGHTVEATYADLAERYEADAEYEPGTVVVFDGDKEITTTDVEADYKVAGVISTDPGLKMNSNAGEDSTHPYVALKGRVPCKIIGPVKKGDLIVTSKTPGYGVSVGGTDMGRSVFAKSLVNNDDSGEKVIEVAII
jgi:hypothetical protein